MLQKSKSNRVKLAKYALLIPMVVGMLIYSSCSENPETAEEPMTVSDQIEALKQIVENEKLSEKDLEALREVLMKARKNSVEIIEVEELPEDNSQYDGLPGVPFAVIDEIPVYPGTPSGLSQQDQKAHFNKQIAQFIGQEFNTDLANELGLTGRQRISVTFKIDTDGNIVDIKSRAPFPALETEAKRVVSLLPQMQPGKQNGKAVNVPYALPIVFEVSE